MFFAVWRHPERGLPQELAVRVAALLSRAGAVRFDSGNMTAAAWRPARIHRSGRGVALYAVSKGCDSWPPGHPSVRLEKDTLTIVAGPLPQYPAYYARAAGDGYLLICSQLEPLATLFPDAPLNGERLVSLLVLVEPDTEGTVYAGICRLRPCETIVATRTGLRASRDFPRIGSTYRRGDPRDLARELRQRLDDAVGRAVGGSKRVAVFVSGGLDSSGVLALAAARCRAGSEKEVDAISLQCAGPGDDRPYFDELMRAQGLNAVRLSSRDAAHWFERCLEAQQPLTGACSCFDLLLGATATERCADVVLCGANGDTVCGRRLPSVGWGQLGRMGKLRAAIDTAVHFSVPGGMSPWARLRYLILSPLIPPTLRRIKRRLVRRPPWMTARSGALWARARRRAERWAGRLPDTPDAWMQELCTSDQLADAADQAAQEAAFTGCFPVDVFLDVDFVRFMLELDPMLLCHGNEFRGLYRLAMKDLLPQRLLRREDKARLEPAIGAAAVAANAFDVLHDLSSLDELATRGLVNPASLRPTLNACIAALRLGERLEEVDSDEQLGQTWQLLSVEAFLRKHGRGRDLVWENRTRCKSS